MCAENCSSINYTNSFPLYWLQVLSQIDIHYATYQAWLLYPLALVFVVFPLLYLVLLYLTILFLHIYRHRRRLKNAYAEDFWNGARYTAAVFWDYIGKVWHGYELVGLEKIPQQGAAIIVYYHGALPIDVYYFVAKCIIYKNRSVHSVGDRLVFKAPGLRLLSEAFCVTPGSVSSLVELMKKGALLTLSPGGVREALFSDSNYALMWGKRFGFAKVALQAQVPIIPMFTQNCREAFRTLAIGRSIFRRLYEYTRLPLIPLYGGFPVKLTTFIGDPILPDANLNAEQLASKVEQAVSELIRRHQRIPGSIFTAICQRF